MDFGVVRLVLDPLFLRMGLHLQLEHVVLLDLVAPEVGQGRFLDDDASGHVLEDVVVADQGCRVLLGQDAARVVVHDQVVLQDALRVDQHHAVEVVVYCVLFDHQLLLALDYEDALALAIFDLVKLDSCFA